MIKHRNSIGISDSYLFGWISRLSWVLNMATLLFSSQLCRGKLTANFTHGYNLNMMCHGINLRFIPRWNNWGPNCTPKKNVFQSTRGTLKKGLQSLLQQLNNNLSWEDSFFLFSFSPEESESEWFFLSTFPSPAFALPAFWDFPHCTNIQNCQPCAHPIQRAIPRQTSWKRCAPGSQPFRWKFFEVLWFLYPGSYFPK